MIRNIRLGILGSLLGLAAASAAAFTMETGPVPHRVYQADASDTADIAMEGKTLIREDGAVEVRVGAGDALGTWTQAGEVRNRRWSATIEDLPVGGPYTIRIRLRGGPSETLYTVSDVFVGDLWLLAGQSNMQGVGNSKGAAPPHPRVKLFAMNDEWRPAEEPLHLLAESRDIVHNPRAQRQEEGFRADTTGWTKGAGLGLPFAALVSEATGRPIGLIANAHGGTSMERWSPSERSKGGRSLYGSMYRRFQLLGSPIRGMLWYQGESDANEDAAPLYKERFMAFIEAVREDFGQPELPFYMVQIGRYVSPVNLDNPRRPDTWDQVQDAQYEIAREMKDVHLVAAVDLPLDDPIHVGTDGLKVLGERLAKRALTDVYGVEAYKTGPRFAGLEAKSTPWGRQLHLRFEGVNGALAANGRVSGFQVYSDTGAPLCYRQELHPDDAATIVLFIQQDPANGTIWYGHGFNPYCNVRDEAGFALPVFSEPIPEVLHKARAGDS